MTSVAIIGAGHAGVEAAQTLAAAGVAVTLFSNEATPPYFRPRLIAAAFGQAAPDAILIHPAAWYAERGIALRLGTPVSRLAPGRLTCHPADGQSEELAFDAVLLAGGAHPIVPDFPGNAQDAVHALWKLADVHRFRDGLRTGCRIVIIGGGVLGLESAARAAETGFSVTVVERMPALLAGHLGCGGTTVLVDTLARAGVTVKTGVQVDRLTAVSDTETDVVLDNGETLRADRVLCAIGALPNLTLARDAGLDTDRGVRVNAFLQTSCPTLFAAGDLAQTPDAPPRCAVRLASLQGKLAAENILAHLNGQPLKPWSAPCLPLFMKTAKAEFQLFGATGDPSLVEERLHDGSQPGLWRSVLKRGDRLAGVRMVGTREGFDALCQQIQQP